MIADIGIPRPVIDELEGPHLELLTRERMRELSPARAADSHKGDFGRVLIVAGSRGKTGAAHLAALGALRSGAGLVTVATPRVVPADRRRHGAGVHDRGARRDRRWHDRLRRGGSRAGSRRGRHRRRAGARTGAGDRRVRPRARRARRRAARARRGCAERVRGDPDRLTGREGVDVIITPHPGEMARLVGMSVDEVQANRLEHRARTSRPAHRVYVVLKGHRTLIADAGREGVRQSHRQCRNGDRRHRRRADRA